MNAGILMRMRRWVIEGYDGTDLVYKHTVAVGMMSEASVTALLQRLACQHLTPDEIFAASLRKSDVGYNPILEPNIGNRPRRTISVGANPHYVASLWEDGEKEND